MEEETLERRNNRKKSLYHEMTEISEGIRVEKRFRPNNKFSSNYY